eukprot:m.330698 g.330698  ORF g.330698 m.330698 type:complete len:590 (+) comp19766_c1_seq6:840-2609(+)
MLRAHIKRTDRDRCPGIPKRNEPTRKPTTDAQQTTVPTTTLTAPATMPSQPSPKTVALVVVLSTLATAQHLGQEPVVTTPDGTLEGAVFGKHERFVGIPFAHPPVDVLRWQPPQTVQPWSGTREAKRFAADCISDKSDYIKFNNVSEDCLYLNVYRPENAKSGDKLAVILFFYGGSFVLGGSSFPVYWGGQMVDHGNVIVVTSNYRLGVFGFLASDTLQKQSHDNSTGNYGLQDQREAMRWVQRNIEAFGGDPQNVMILGESAGAGSVTDHVVAHRSNGLFRRAGIESGPPTKWVSKTMAEAGQLFQRVAEETKCNATSEPDTVACLRALGAEQLISDKADSGSGLIVWAPVQDGVEFTAPPQQLWESGAINPIDTLLLGTNRDEGTEFLHVPGGSSLTEANYTVWLHTRYGKDFGSTLQTLYPAASFKSPWFAASMIFTDSLMACPSRRGARWMKKYRGNNTQVYLYHFTHQLELLRLFDSSAGVPHASELPLVFKTLPLLVGEKEDALSDTFMSYWTSIARAGNPNEGGPGVPSWPEFDSATGNFMQLDLTTTPGQHLKAKQCDFWDRVYEAGCQMLNPPCPCNITL